MALLRVGIDPSATTCVARVVDELGIIHGKPIKFKADRPSVAALVRRVHALSPGAPCHFLVEASGYWWYPLAGLLREQQEAVSLVCPSYTKRQRRCSSPFAKGDAADAEALARVVASRGEKVMHPADIPEGPRLNLRLLARQRATMQQEATAIKLRLLAWLGLTAPGLMAVLGRSFDAENREFILRYPVIGKVLRRGKQRLQSFLQQQSDQAIEQDTVDELWALAQDAYSPKDLDDATVAIQFEMELERLDLLNKQIKRLDKLIEPFLEECDPQKLALSLPGFGPVVSAIMVAEAGTDLSRFPDSKRFCSWTGVVARASGTAGKHVDGMPITKAGRGIVKWALYMAASAAINCDPQLRALYDRLKAKGKHHNTAVTAVAHQLARIYFCVMTEQRPFQKRPPKEPLQPLDET